VVCGADKSMGHCGDDVAKEELSVQRQAAARDSEVPQGLIMNLARTFAVRS
jgi:hypothetical protein